MTGNRVFVINQIFFKSEKSPSLARHLGYIWAFVSYRVVIPMFAMCGEIIWPEPCYSECMRIIIIHYHLNYLFHISLFHSEW